MLDDLTLELEDDDLENENDQDDGLELPPEVTEVFSQVIQKLIKADQLLAEVAICDAKNTEVQDLHFQETVSHQIEMAEKELDKADEELNKGRPDKAIKRFEPAWHHAQIAIRLANSETSSRRYHE